MQKLRYQIRGYRKTFERLEDARALAEELLGCYDESSHLIVNTGLRYNFRPGAKGKAIIVDERESDVEICELRNVLRIIKRKIADEEKYMSPNLSTHQRKAYFVGDRRDAWIMDQLVRTPRRDRAALRRLDLLPRLG